MERTPATLFAMALNSAGFQITSINKHLLAYIAAGGTIEHLLEVAQLDKCKDTNGAYVAKAALGELTDKSPTPGGSNAVPRKNSAAEQTRAAIAGRAGDGFEYG